MEKMRNFSWKPSRFVLLSLTLSFSLMFLSFFCFGAMRTPSVNHQESFLLLNTPSLILSLNPLNIQSLTGPITDSSAYSVNYTKFTDTHFENPQNSSGVFANVSISEVVVVADGDGEVSDSNLRDLEGSNLGVAHLRKPQNSSGFFANVSISEVVVVADGRSRTNVGEVSDSNFRDLEGSNLGIAHLRKPQNSSGFVESSISEGSGEGDSSTSMDGKLQRKEDVGEVGKSGFSVAKDEPEPRASSIGEVDQEIQKKIVKNCDVSKGKWVFDDESYPLYTNFSCPFIDEGFNCQGNGRHDTDYMKLRWKPHDCDIPRFNATNMLEMIRGKRLVFVGDSINRNQWESLLCLLMGAIKDPSKVYETHGRRITKGKGIYSFRFVDYQCTVEFYVTHFLVHETKARIGRKRKETLRIDSIDKSSSRWKGADILIFNTGNWWSHFKTKAGINYYQEGKQIYPHLDVLMAYRRALTTWATWVDRHINPHKTHVFFRSTTPAHFRGGQWNTGGHCGQARKPLSEMYIDQPEKNLVTQEVISKMKTRVIFLNVTGLSSYRIDGHPSKYGISPGKRGSSVEDCSHWCLPGVPDAWNELIYHQLLLKLKTSGYAS